MYDVVVIGAGSGGITSAVTAAGFGKKVLLVDRSKPGGECTWSGCVPSKALINEAKKVHTVRNEIEGFSYDSKKAMDHIHSVREKIYSHESPEALEKLGIEFKQGHAEFKDGATLLVNGEELKGRTYIISTGSSPFVPDIDGIDSVPYLTNESIFELERLPDSLIVLGGGPIGVELAQAASRLGTRVELVEMMDSLMFREERDFTLAIQDRLSEEGVALHLGARAESVSSGEKGVILRYDRKGEKRSLEADALLVAIGRKPNLDGLGLDRAGIRYNRKGIEVNSRLRTSRAGVYAIGDVAGPYQFSHMANAQGIVATQNAILPVKRRMNYKHTAWVTFTEPEMARAGMTEAEAREIHGDSVRIYHFDFNQLDRAVTGGESIERAKLVLDKKGKVLGASILADRAGELIGELQLLKSRGINFAAMGSVIHPYPTYAELFSKMGKKVLVDNILNHPLVRLFRKKESL